MSPEDRFVRELENLRRESDSAAQFLYSWLAFNDYAARNRPTLMAVNRVPLFWNTQLGALQAAMFMSLGRMFDRDTRSHSISRLLTEASRYPQIFSRNSLAARKRTQVPGASWIRGYVTEAYVPTKRDFNRLSRFVANKRAIYEKAYQPIRHQIFAHSGAGSKEKKDFLFGNTQLGELQRLVLSLRAFHEVMWQLFFNGKKPSLKSGKYSINTMRRGLPKLAYNAPLEQRIVRDTYEVLRMYTAGARLSAS